MNATIVWLHILHASASCMLPSDIDLLRDGKILENPKLQALQKFTRRLIEALLLGGR